MALARQRGPMQDTMQQLEPLDDLSLFIRRLSWKVVVLGTIPFAFADLAPAELRLRNTHPAK